VIAAHSLAAASISASRPRGRFIDGPSSRLRKQPTASA
jgi:hypothetical protein